MPKPGEWEFCRRADCPDRKPAPGLQDRFSARQWLQQFQHDTLKMATMRSLLAEHRGGSLFRMSNAAVVEQVAELVSSGRVHLHVSVPEPAPSAPKPPAPAGSPPPPPRRAPPVAASRLEVPDPPTFPAGTNLAAQAATLVAAAAAGTPFCPI